MIFNCLNPYVRTPFADRYYSDLSSAKTPSFSSFPGNPYGLSFQDDYLLEADPEPSNKRSGLDSIVKRSDPIDRFLDSKREVLLNSATSILEQIYERLTLRDNNLYEINQRISRADSILDQLDVFELGALPVIDKRKAIIEKELITFEQEGRFEKVACWRDVSRLQGQLLELKQQIDSQSNRQKLIND